MERRMHKSPFHVVMDFLSEQLLRGQVFCLLMMTFVVFAQVVLREVFKIGIQWAFELACFFQVTLVFLGMPVLLYKKSNISVSLLLDKLPPKGKQLLNIIGYLVAVFSVDVMAYGFYLYITKAGSFTTATLQMPNYLFFFSAGIGIALSIVALLCQLIDFFKKTVVSEAGGAQ